MAEPIGIADEEAVVMFQHGMGRKQMVKLGLVMTSGSGLELVLMLVLYN